MKKLSKFGRSTLSLLLCLTMLLTTFCFFDIGSVISEAIISKGDHALTEAGTTSNTFAEYSINLPELIYIKPGGKDSQYFLNSSTDGSVSEPTSSTSVLSFACSTARSVTFSVALYDSTLSSTVSTNRITNIAFADGTYMSSDKSLSVSASSVNKTIKSVTLASAETAKEYIIQWTIVYTTASGSYTTYAYTGVKFPSLAQAGMTTRGYYYGTEGGVAGNPAEQAAYSFLTGVDSVAGGNVGSKFMSTGSSLTAPLVNFNSSIYPKSLSAPIDSNYFDPDGEGVLVAYAERNNSPYFGQGSRIFHTVWDLPGDKSYIPKNMITNASYFGGAPSTTADSYGYAAANITIDTSRYTDFSQVPNFSAGFVEFDSDGGEDQNYLHVIRNCSYSGWDAASYFRKNRTDGLSAGSMNTQATIWCPDVDQSDEPNDKVFVRGLYKLSGNIYNAKTNLTKSTSGGVSRTIASYNNGVYTTYMRFEYSLRWNPWIGSSEYSSHIAAVRLNATLVDRGSARTYYHKFLNSGVNTSASNWSTINGYLKEYAKSLCVSTSSAGSITDPTSAISTAQANLKTTMKTSTPLSPPLYFYVPEAIYLVPQVNSWISQTRSQFQYFIQNNISDITNPLPKSTRDTTGTVYFNYPNASEFKLSFKWLNSSGNEMGSTSSTTASYYNSNSYINFGGTSRYAKSEYSFSLSSGVLNTTMTTTGYSPYLVSGDTGCYIEWTASYKDSTDGHYKTAVAYTYVYKPYVVSTAAGANVRCTDGKDHDNSQLSWMSGFHNIASVATKPTAGSKDQKAAYLRYTTVDKAYACMPFMSYDTGSVKGDLNFPISGMGTSGNANVVMSGKPDYRLQSTAMKLAFASTTNTSSYFKYKDYGNNWAHDWMSTTMKASATLSSSTTTNKLTGSFFYWESGKDLTAAINTGGVGGLYIDTSRYSNLNQIPNLGVGMQMTDNRDTSTSDNGAWMIADATDITSSTYTNSQDNGNKMREEWGNVNYYIAGMGTPDNRNSSYDSQNLKYAGNWNRSLLEGTTKDYQIKTAQMNNQGGDWVTVIVYLKLRCYQADKSDLRKAVRRAQNNFPNLGIYNSGTMNSYYYTGSTYTNFVNTYKSACRELTKVDGGTASSVATLVTNLNNYLDSLVTGTDLKKNCTAREYNLGLEKLADGKYKIIEIPNAKQYSLTYNARDNVYFAPDSYTGFTYAGSYELTNTSITPSSYYGKVLASFPKFLSSSDYTSKAMSVSGTTATIATTTEKTTTVPKFDGNATTFEWVAAVNDTSLTMVNFYYLDRNTISFDPNDGSSKVNLLNEATVRKSANNFYAPTTTVSGSNGVTVTYNQKTNIYTFNGTPTGGLTYFTLPIAGRLKADTSYTYRAVYVGGSATIPSGTSLTISLDICKADGTKCYKASGTTYNDRFCFDYTCGGSTASRTLSPDAYQAANAEFLQIFTYSSNYTLSPTYNNLQVKLELVESGTANSTFSPNTKEAYYGRQLGTLPTPVRENYEFLGWFTAPDGGERVTASDIMGTEDMTVYAHWEPDSKVVLLDNDFDFDDFVGKGSTAATTLNGFANSFKACASPGYQNALTDQTKPFTSMVFNESNGETALNISYDRSSIGDSGVDELFDTLKSTTYTASTAGEYTVSYEYRINDYYSKYYEENGNDEYDSVIIGFSTDSGYWYSGGDGVSYTENKSTTEGYEKVTLTRTLSANTNYFFTTTFYFCNSDGANELRADIDIKNIVVKDPNGNIVLSSNSLAITNGSASFDPDAREITLKPTAADCYTSTYSSTARYRSSLEAGKKYTLMMDYNASTNVRIRPYIFFYPSATSTSYTSTAAIVVDVPAGTGTYAMQFTVPTDNYYQIRFGIYNYQNGSTLPGSVTFGNISIQRTEIYADGAYNTDSSTYLGWVSKVTGPSSTSSAVYANDLNSRYEKITSHYQDIGYQNAYTNLRVPTREGYDFVGWFDASGTQYTDASGVGTKICTADGLKLYSRWTAKSFSLKYNAYKPNDSKGVATSGTVGSLPSPNPQSLKFGIASAISSTLPTLTGYTFAGWSTTSGGSAAYQKGAALSASTVTQMYQSCSGGTYNLYTAWTANKFYVKFNGNGSTSGTMSNQQFTYDVYQKLTQNAFVNSRTVTYNKNDTTAHPATLSTTSVTKELSFKGWTASAEAVATANPTVKYTNQQEIKNPNGYATSGGTTNLYAKWQGVTVTLPTPTRTGYTFAGWYDAASGGTKVGDAGASYIITADKTLYAHWTIKSYTVTYDYSTNGGTSATKTTASVNYGAAVDLTPTATKSGWTFVGWNTNKDATTALSSLTMPANNVTLYAIYKKTLTANFYSGTNKATNDPRTVTIWNRATSGTVTSPTTYTSVWTFVGWTSATTATASTSYIGTGVTVTITASQGTVNYYALYKALHTLVYDANGGSGAPAKSEAYGYYNSYPTQQNGQHTISSTVPTKTGYTFGGWNTNTSGTGTNYTAGQTYTNTASSNTLYAKWTANTITLKYNGNGNTGGTIPADSTFTYGASVTTAAAPTRAYTITYNANSGTVSPTSATATYTFGGWKSSANSKNYNAATAYTDSFGATSGSVTLTAQWSGGTVTLPNPTRTGYTFVGWYDAASGGTKVGDAGKIYTATANKTLYAHWTPNTITLKYNGNGNTGGTIPADSTFTYGASVTTAAAPTRAYTITYNANSGTVSPASATATYTFGGWKSSANSKNYSAATAYTDSFGATSGSVTLTAQWSGGTVTLPTPTRTGYTFIGWYDAASGGTKIGDAGASYTATANKTLYAHWTPNTITLKYNGNGNTGGTIPADSTFSYGASVTTASAPTRAYTITYNANSGTVSPTSATATYTFGGWKSSANSKNYNAATAYTDSFGATSGSVTLTAQWSGGTVTLPTPTRTGYTFTGWYDAASGGTKIGDAGASYTATANKTLYAHWTANTITLKYNGNGNTGGTIPADSTFSYGSSVTTAAAPTRAYTVTYNANSGTVSPASATATYTFGGWKSSANSKNYNAATAYTDSFGATSGSVTLTAQWSGGTVTLPTPTRTGYTFAGWYDAASGGTKIGNAGASYTATANKTLYAHWTANTITLKYNGNGNTGGTIPADSTFSYGSSVTTAAAPTRAYTVTYNANSGTVSPASATATYTFGGWKSSANSKNYNAATAYTDSFGATSGNVTLTAQWSGGSVTLPTPTRTGYTFVGWYDASSGGTKIGDAGASYTATANKTLYAHWTANTITLKYNGNGNTGGTVPADSTFSYGSSVTTAAAPTRAYTITYNANSGTVSPASATATYTFGGWKSSANSKNYNAATAYTDSFGATSGSVTLTAQWSGGTVTLPTPTRTGYTFVGWYDASSGGNKIGDAGASYTATANKTLYAHWEVNTYSVTYDYATNRGTSATKTSATVEYGAAVDLTPTATKSGWTFVGWNTDQNATTALTSLTMPDKDITLYAIYTKTITAKFYWINAADGKTVTETQTVIIVNAATSGTVTCSTTPASVTYNSRTFTWIGWRTDTTAAAQTKTKSTSQSVSADTSFYAVYSGTLTLSYNANKGTDAPSSQTATQYLNSTGTTGSVSYKKSTCTFTVSTTVPKYTGWTFDGWATTSTATSGKYGASPKTTEISVNANTTLYAIWNKAFTVNFYYYNNQVETQSVTIYNGASSVTVTSPTIEDQTVGGITYTGRGWSTSNSATASVSVASGANVSVSGNANYYASYEVTRTATFYYCTEPTSTIKGSGAAQSSVTADAVRYMNYTGAVADSNYTVPTQVTSSHGNGVAEDYIGVSTAKNNSSTVTPTTANVTFYAVYSEILTFYYYNGSAHTSSSLTRYMLSNGTSYNASMSGTVPTPSNIDSKTVWSGNWSYENSSYNTGYFRTPTATGVNSLYAVYNKSVALIYNLNGGTSSAIANTTGTAHLISKNGGVNTFAVSLAITDTVPTKTDYTFLGWADTASATAPQYYAKHTFSLSADKTIYAVWLETATPDEKVDNKDVYSTEIDVVKGVKVTGFTDDDVTVQEITTKHKLYNSSENAAYQALCEAYTNALNTYKNSPSVDNAKALTTARNNLANAVAPKYNSSDRTYLDGKFTVEYASGVTDRPVAAGEHSVSELNLNHYSTANLDSTLYQLETTVGISLANMQTKINEAVKTIAKNFVAKSLAKDTDPMYSVYENAQKAIATGLTGTGIKAINYVYTGKGNYTYYCYTNTATPTLLLTVDDVVGNGRVCYPTKSKVEKTATVSGTVNSSAYSIGTTSVDNDEYLAYLAMGMGTSMTGGASYYSQKSVIKLTPTFTSGKNGSVSYQIKASDDSYNSASTEFGGNYATTSKLSSGKTSNAISTSTPDTNVTPVNTITIVIDYHETTNEAGYRNSMYIYGDQVINDKWLKQFHILRSSGGASNWEWPKTTDTIYTVDDGTYGQSNYGSFTYTFTYTSGASNNFAAASLGTIDAATIAGLLKSTANYNSMKAKKFAGANKGGDGLGYMEWPASGGWNINYYPKNQAYTYVHIVDRWGNVDDKVIYVGNIDAIAAQFKTASVGEYTVLEDGGSGFETLSLNSTGFGILTDENSTLENNVFRTAGNTVRISTGEANKAYTLTMTDKATNSSTATVKSDENGIITLNVEDTAYESGVYTFMLNSVEVNLYDGAETDKYVLSVSGDEVDEGEAAQITVTTKGDVSKLRFTDASGNTSTVSSFVQNEDGTRTWTFAKAKPAGEYTYKITVKVGHEWLDEGDTAALIFNERILDSGKVRSAEYDEETGLYKVTFEGRATKVQFVSEDGMTRTYTRYAESVKSRKTYDADGNEVNDTARTLDHEVWYVEARLYSGQNYTVAGKFEAGWNRAEDATSTVTGK